MFISSCLRSSRSLGKARLTISMSEWSEMSQHMVYCLSDQICGGHREASFAVGDGRLYPAVFEPERDIDGIPGLERGTETKVRNYFVAVQLHHPAFPIVFL